MCNHECKRCGERFQVAQETLKLTMSPGAPQVFYDLTFPVRGAGPKTWGLTGSQTDEWREAYPGLDVLAECRKARVWLAAQGHLKTAPGMPRFLVSWLNKAADMQRATGRQVVAAPANQRCDWHKRPGSTGKPNLAGALAGCPECKEIRLRRVLREGEPEAVDPMAVIGGRR